MKNYSGNVSCTLNYLKNFNLLIQSYHNVIFICCLDNTVYKLAFLEDYWRMMSRLPFARIGAMTSFWCLLKVSKLKTPRQHKVSDSHSIHFYILYIVYALCYPLVPVLCELLLSFWFSARLIFWKNPCHKLYAVSKADLKSGDSKKWALIIDSDEEEDGEPRKNQEKKARVEEKLSLVLEELATIKDKDPTWSDACHKGNLQVPNMPPCP